MFIPGNFGVEVDNVTDKLLQIKGDISDEEAEMYLAELLVAKPGLMYRLLTGEILFEFQMVKIGMLSKRDFINDISSRGGAKSFTTAVFALIYAICNPGIKILVISNSLRQAKMLLGYIIDITKKPEAHLLRQFVTEKDYKRDPDRYSLSIGTGIHGPKSEIFAMALGDGKKIRGARAQVLIIDEAFAVPANIVDEVLGPMMIVNADVTQRMRIKSIEDKLIKAGKMAEEDRQIFKNNKLIMLSSACFEFEPLYKRFKNYVEKITNPEYLKSEEGKKTSITYGIVNLHCDTFPEALLSKDFIASQKDSMSEDAFRREYEAQFSPDSSSYYKMSLLAKQTLQPGEYPHIEIRGDDPKRYFYILGIDPNFDNSEVSDNFAIAVLKVDRLNLKKGFLVHNYAVAGLDAESTINYMIYLITHFNVEYIIIDHAGARQSLDMWNNSSLFKERNLRLDTFEADLDDENDSKKVRAAKSSYNVKTNAIVHIQYFHSKWIREANEYMQMCFQKDKIKFASPPMDSDFETLVKRTKIPIEKIDFLYSQKNEDNFKEADWLKRKQYDFVEHQSKLIENTKIECANVKMIASPQGNQSFDLPDNMRKQKRPDKPRKDSYSALLLANWGRKCCELLSNTPEEDDYDWGGPMML